MELVPSDGHLPACVSHRRPCDPDVPGTDITQAPLPGSVRQDPQVRRWEGVQKCYSTPQIRESQQLPALAAPP